MLDNDPFDQLVAFHTVSTVSPFSVSLFYDETLPAALQTQVCNEAFFSLIARQLGAFHQVALSNNLYQGLSFQPDSQTLLLEVSFVSNALIQIANARYRDKNEATDVLSFPVYDLDHPPPEGFPVVSLGDLLLSVEWWQGHSSHVLTPHWAEENSNSLKGLGFESIEYYVTERLSHGMLHLLGVHHDTDWEYNKVVDLQRSILDVIFIR